MLKAHFSDPKEDFSVSFPTNRVSGLEPETLGLVPPPFASPALPHSSRLPMWPSSRRPWPSQVGVCCLGTLGRRGFPRENAAARICREAGGRVRSNAFVRDLDLGVVDQFDTRRLEVVVDGLPLPRCANGNRHNCGLPFDKGRRCSAPSSHSQRRTP